MISRLVGAAKAAFYKIKFGGRISFSGIPAIDKGAEIKVKQGKMTVGKGFSAKPGAYFAVVNNGQLCLKQGVSFGRNCIVVCHNSICVGDNVHIGPHVLIYDHDHIFDGQGIQEGFRTGPISIGKNVWIGAGVIILRDTVIGDGCVVGAGCVVKGNIPPYSLVTSGRKLDITPLTNKYGQDLQNES